MSLPGSRGLATWLIVGFGASLLMCGGGDEPLDLLTPPPGDATGPDATVGVDGSIPGLNDATPGDGASHDSGDAGIDVVTRPPRGRDAGVITDAAACPSPGLTQVNSHLYVDAEANPAVSNGSSACPYRSISSAIQVANGLNLVGKTLTIHVWGTTGTTYTEFQSLTLPSRVTLTSAWEGLPADRDAVTISTQGNCQGGFGCAILVSAGATLEGVTVKPGPGGIGLPVGIITGPRLSNQAAPVIRNVRVRDTAQSGIQTLGDARLGPDVEVIDNAGDGMTIDSDPNTTILITGTGNRFDKNKVNGIRAVNRGNTLTIEQASASDNEVDGIEISGQQNAQATRTIGNLTANRNKRNGITLASYQTVTVADSSFNGNGANGIWIYGLSHNLMLNNDTTANNGADGVRVQIASTVSLTNLRATGNGTGASGGAGLRMMSGSGTVSVRQSRLLGNTVGVLVERARIGDAGSTFGGTLDIGTSQTLGGNVLGVSGNGKNARSGLCLVMSSTTGSFAAQGNAWSACPPAQTGLADVANACVTASSYSDIAYVAAAGGTNPVAAGAGSPECTVGGP